MRRVRRRSGVAGLDLMNVHVEVEVEVLGEEGEEEEGEGERRRGLGIIECHSEGWATRGRWPVETRRV